MLNESTGQYTAGEVMTKGVFCMDYAEWLVESYLTDSIPLPNFGTITFTSAQAGTLSDLSIGPGDAGISLYDISYSNQIYTSTTVVGEHSLEVTYV